MNLAAALNDAAGDDDLMFTTTVAGALRATIVEPVEWSRVSAVLKVHDVTMTLVDNVATFTANDGAEVVADEIAGVVTETRAGPLLQTAYANPICTSVDLDALAARSDVLKVRFSSGVVQVVAVVHSDVRDGLSHLHRRGLVAPRGTSRRRDGAAMKRSVSGKRAAVARAGRSGLLSRLRSHLGI